MALQAFVDDSGSPGSGKHFVLAGLVSESESWAQFSLEWRACLAEEPAVPVLKMREAAGLNGAFNRWTEQARDEKLRKLVRIINRHVRMVIWCMIDMEAQARAWKDLQKPHNEVYFWPFQAVIAGIALDLWEHGWREPFEIIFDEQVIFGPRAKAWYPILQEVVRFRENGPENIMPSEPIFRTDDDELPIQAADLYAWCIRRNNDKPDQPLFGWLLDELRSVSKSDYCEIFDLERMLRIRASMEQMEVPASLVEKGRELLSGQRPGDSGSTDSNRD